MSDETRCFHCGGILHQAHDMTWLHRDSDNRCQTRSKWSTHALPIHVRSSEPA